jgi:transposase
MNIDSSKKYDRINLQLRRNEVMKYATMGFSQEEIADKVKVSQQTVSLDLQYLECMSTEKMKEHIDITIPNVHNMCVTGLKLTLKKAWNSIYDKDGKDRELRPTELTQKLSLIAELYEKIYNMTTEAPTLTRAMEIVRLEKERLKILEDRYGHNNNDIDISVNTRELREIQESISKLEPDTAAEEKEEEEEDTDTTAEELEEEPEEEIVEVKEEN